LNRETDRPVVAEIRERVKSAPDDGDARVTFHVWRVGKSVYSREISVLTHAKADARCAMEQSGNFLSFHRREAKRNLGEIYLNAVPRLCAPGHCS
jgi:uncharacterized protein (DUF39 family)